MTTHNVAESKSYPARAHDQPIATPASRVSQKRKLAYDANGEIDVPQFAHNATSVISYLSILGRAQEAQDRRSHTFLHRVIVAGYAVAAFLKAEQTAWAIFCLDDFWQGERQGPKPKNQKSILRHTFIRIFGKRSKTASNWSLRLKENFDAGASPEQIAHLLKRAPKDKAMVHKRATLSSNKPLIIPEREKKYFRCAVMGVYEGGETAAIKLKMDGGVCAKVSVVIEYVESRANPTNPVRLRVQKILQGEYPKSNAVEHLVTKANAPRSEKSRTLTCAAGAQSPTSFF